MGVDVRLSRPCVWALVPLTFLTVVACADTRDQSVCEQAGDLQSSVQELRDLDTETADAGDLRAAADQVRLEVQQLRAAADGSLQQAASDLQVALDDLRSSLSDVDEESLEVARPLIDEAWQDAVSAYEELEQGIDATCTLG